MSGDKDDFVVLFHPPRPSRSPAVPRSTQWALETFWFATSTRRTYQGRLDGWVGDAWKVGKVRWFFSRIFHVDILWTWSNLTKIFQMGWFNHQLEWVDELCMKNISEKITLSRWGLRMIASHGQELFAEWLLATFIDDVSRPFEVCRFFSEDHEIDVTEVMGRHDGPPGNADWPPFPRWWWQPS